MAVRVAHLCATCSRIRASRRGQDERGQGRARVRPDRRRDSAPEDVAAATGAGARTEQLDPEIATTVFIKDDRDGKVFVDSTRVGGATVVSAFSPRARAPVSFPVAWDDLDAVAPGDFTVHTVFSSSTAPHRGRS